MANLIITIISIALLAVVAITAMLYLNGSLDNAQATAWSNAMISQSQQLSAAGRAYSLDHGGADYSTVPIYTLIANGYLSTWPDAAMMGPLPVSGNVSTGQFDNGCYNVNGWEGQIHRDLCVINGLNVVHWQLRLNDPFNSNCNSANAGQGYGWENTKYANHPIVAMAVAVNKSLRTVPASATIAPTGLPYMPVNSSATCTWSGGSGTIAIDANSNPLVNYCYLSGLSGSTSLSQINCVFSN